jgi:putative FmdB family regulatory protein
MPIFEYQCRQCGHVFDALQKLGEGTLRKCPECGRLALEKLLSTPAFQVKGKFKEVTRKRSGHNLDGGASHSHDHSHDHSHGHSHSHGGHTHTHGPGCGHKH